MSIESHRPKDIRAGKNPLNIKQTKKEDDFWNLDDDTPVTDISSEIETTGDAQYEASTTPVQDLKVDTQPDSEPDSQPAIKKPVTDTSSSGSLLLALKNYLKALSLSEKISISVLVVIISVSGIFSYIHFYNKIFTAPTITEELDFPIKGQTFTITSLETYWRKPVTTGENPDVIRLNTALIPCVRLSIEGNSGAIRVLFYDDQKNLVGDSLSRKIEGQQTFEVAATAGFEEIGMHTAYVANMKYDWSIEILEGPSIEAPKSKFKSILKTYISSTLN